MATVNNYLTFNGNCEEVFNFYKEAFRGKFSYLARFSEMVNYEGTPNIPEIDKNKIMHIRLPISKETVLLGSDIPESMANTFRIGNNFSIYVNSETKEEADRLFNALSKGGNVIMPMGVVFWGA